MMCRDIKLSTLSSLRTRSPTMSSPHTRNPHLVVSSRLVAIAVRHLAFRTMNALNRAPASPKSLPMMDGHSRPPASKYPFFAYLANASPTHFDSKHIDDELQKPDSKLQMILKEAENLANAFDSKHIKDKL
jgi:hypothetical protein